MSERNRARPEDDGRTAGQGSQARRTREDSVPEADYPRGYDETVRRGPPLDTGVAQGDYRPGRDNLVGAGVRGYGEPGAYRQWEQADDSGREGRGTRGEASGASGDDVPPGGVPAGRGIAGGWGRLGGWRHGDNAMQQRSGPKGYRRSDDRIREDLCEHLMDIGDIDSSDVEVRVQNGHVTLEGTVPERGMKYLIEDIAATTLGVAEVENNIRVPRQRNAEGPDA